jgi:hypothetical protein
MPSALARRSLSSPRVRCARIDGSRRRRWAR